MSLSSTCIKRPVLATVLNLILVIVGSIGLLYLGVRDYPSVDPPVISVSTSFVGANADVIETQITEPLESAINGIQGIRSLSSTSRDGQSRITIEFELSVDLETAANDVRDKVSGTLRRLPQDIDPPTVYKADADAQPIFAVSLRSGQRSLIDLSGYAERYYKERLQTIPGVSSVDIWGEKRYSVRLRMDPALLAAHRLTPMDVQSAVEKENIELPSGRVEGDNTELTIRTLGRLMSIEDFNNLVISREGSKIVRFKDIGVAEVDAENTRSIAKRNGLPMVMCALIPQPGANYIDIADRAYLVMQDLEKDLPEDIDATIAFDNTVFIRSSINEVEDTIFEAFLLVVLIIFLFLRSWRTTLIPVLAIPVSLIASFFIMYVAGFTINILTLLAVVLAIGLVVDDAIVVMENIFTKIEQGMSPLQAGFKGSNEIFFAVIATTVVLVAVFFPIVFLEGTTGRLFREFSVVIAGAVVVSGMALGIDAICHRGALDASGDTIAVLGCGVDVTYPKQNFELMLELERKGLVLSEFKPGTRPSRSTFPIRNRIISGLSQGTLVVEGSRSSGALITARCALSQGRDLFALPGMVGEQNSEGTNALLREGATPVTCAADLLSDYSILYPDKVFIERIPVYKPEVILTPVKNRKRTDGMADPQRAPAESLPGETKSESPARLKPDTPLPEPEIPDLRSEIPDGLNDSC